MKYQTKGELAYEQIRQAILDGDIPIGSKLTVSNLAAKYKLSLMPVREALAKLTQEGLVQSSPHQGARVAGFNYYEHLESSLIRSSLEKQLFQVSLQFADKISIDQLRESYDRMCQLLDKGSVLTFSQERHTFFKIMFDAAPLKEVKRLSESYYERYLIFHYFVVKIAEQDGLDRTWELLSEIKTLLHALEERKYEVCTVVYDQILKNDFLVFTRYLLNCLDNAETADGFLWGNEALTKKRQDDIRRDIEMFIYIRLGSPSLR